MSEKKDIILPSLPAEMIIKIAARLLTQEEFEKEWGDSSGHKELKEIAKPSLGKLDNLILLCRKSEELLK
jgi:hypothetical protein